MAADTGGVGGTGGTADEADGVNGRDQATPQAAESRRTPHADAAHADATAAIDAGAGPAHAGSPSEGEAGQQRRNTRADADADAVAAPAARRPAEHPVDTSPPPHADASAPAAPLAADPSRKAAMRRQMGTALLLVAVGATVVLSSAGRVWAEGAVAVHDSRFVIEASGSAVGKLPAALALLALAAGVAVLATRGRGRLAVGAILALAGAGIATAAVSGASDRSALDTRAASKAAVDGVRAVDVGHTAWPWISAIGGVLILLGGLVVILRGRDWPGMGSRYEAPNTRPQRRVATSADMWNALDRGEDPTR